MNMQELWFLCITCRLNVLYKCIEFHFNTSNCYQVIKQTQNSITMIKGNNSKNIQSRVMVLGHETLSECALQMYESSLKYL